MCIHPRCKRPPAYILTGTLYGKSVQLCAKHGPRYKEKRGGKLTSMAEEREMFRKGLQLTEED